MSRYDLTYIITIPIYSLSVFIAMKTFFIKRSDFKFLEFLLYTLHAIAICVLFFFDVVPMVQLLSNFVLLFIISLIYKSSMLKRLSISILILASMLTIEILSGYLIGVLSITPYIQHVFASETDIIIVRVLMLTCFFIFNKLKLVSANDLKLPARYYIAYCLILIATLYLYIFSLSDKFLTPTQILLSNISITAVIFFVLMIDRTLFKTFFVFCERNTLKHQVRQFESQQEMIKQSLTTVSALKHDMKNHLLSLTTLYENGKYKEASNYYKKIIEEIDSKGLANTQNFIIDSLINFKLQSLINKDVIIELDLQIPSNLQFDGYDITVILGNLLDNAIAGLETSQGEKYLLINMKYAKGNIIINIINSFSGNLRIENGKLCSTKTNELHHGIGIANVQKILDNYNGELIFNYENSRFSVSVIIPFLIMEN